MWLKKRLWTGKDSREHWFEMTYEHAYVCVLCNVSHMNILVILYCSPMPCEMEYFFFLMEESMKCWLLLSCQNEAKSETVHGKITTCYLGVTWGKYSVFLKINKIEREC